MFNLEVRSDFSDRIRISISIITDRTPRYFNSPHEYMVS